ncbi:tRNA(Ile)-lysidine synthase [Aquimixticola soesokkakensis]|uniref:tRNA(Ile)-lysidine synthase n=1 Tax=Aquimixticola soesokkakensis TaxID=1519096 RepID=A0A1Y5S764_9RHOB|nr:tRNA lysidine(34) synthetase TilS [Aquimixticola soesokkakensis]SLN32727.1 tRNA(Ile)-lysidine synthase [Aquimixticola soesokkakensis]
MSAPNIPFLLHCIASAFAHDKPRAVGVAVSGGGDSMAMLRLMVEWAGREKITLHAVTVDHGLRAEAAQEARFVGDTCAALGVSHDILRWDDWDGSGNLQGAARRARYTLIGEWARGRGLGCVALAHTADDQAETFFMRLAREAGLDGLTGMARRREEGGLTWVRPLLMQERFELRAYLREIRQPWIDDPSNDDAAFERVKARKAMGELAPLGIDMHVVGRVMDHLAQVQQALDVATQAHARSCLRVAGGALCINRRKFGQAAPEINRRLMSQALRWLSSADYGPRAMALQDFLSALLRGRAATLHGCRLLAGKEEVWLLREYGAIAGLAVPAGALWDQRWQLKCEQSEGLVIRALGSDGLGARPEWRASGLPREVLEVSPGLWQGDNLRVAPLLDSGSDGLWTVPDGVHFFSTLLSH